MSPTANHPDLCPVSNVIQRMEFPVCCSVCALCLSAVMSLHTPEIAVDSSGILPFWDRELSSFLIIFVLYYGMWARVSPHEEEVAAVVCIPDFAIVNTYRQFLLPNSSCQLAFVWSPLPVVWERKHKVCQGEKSNLELCCCGTLGRHPSLLWKTEPWMWWLESKS